MLLLSLDGLCAASEEAIQCPLCSQEKLDRCKQPAGCEELVREPGCGCCATCALAKGMLCGVYTPRCGSGLRCYPPPGVEKPLHTLMHGQGLCMDEAEVQLIQETFLHPGKDEISNSDNPHNSHISCGLQDKKCLQKYNARNQRGASAKLRQVGNPIREDIIMQGPCQSELKRALDRFAASPTRTHEDFYTIPIPNCDKQGNFHPKQCHPALEGQRGKCWCVNQMTGVKIPDSPEVKGDLDCQPFLADTLRE
ncbi:insulin-like growth factor-binding protein 4 [Latimeria chalumnae]|uniref:insulin-like growth factor-binding protein 4 n=1 Tax=Latimeria chalumnae TaxID=7897 RepID=UPI00313C8272